MYKKLLYILIILGFSAFQAANAQVCIPDPQFTQPGIYPDTITGFADGCAGNPYVQLVTNVVPADTLVSPGPPPIIIPIDSVIMTSVTGLPPGFTFQCEPPSCSWPGGTTGCVNITGTPAIQDTGTYNLSITIDAYLGGGTTAVTTILNAYSITIQDSANCPATGLADIEFTKFAAVLTTPNPFTDKTEIVFSLPTTSSVDFKVYNLLGKVVYGENIKAKAGVNTIEFISKGLPSGIYLYNLRNESNSVTRKMIISH